MGMERDEWTGAYATKALHEAIDKYQKQNSCQTEQMLRLTERIANLTIAILILTGVMALTVGYQIYLTPK